MELKAIVRITAEVLDRCALSMAPPRLNPRKEVHHSLAEMAL
jgi:hypothetical protein